MPKGSARRISTRRANVERRRRLEEERRQRREAERRRTVLFGAGGIVVGALIVAGAVYAHTHPAKHTAASALKSAQQAAGCSSVHTDQTGSTATTTKPVDYSTGPGPGDPPSSGPSSPYPLSDRQQVYPLAEHPAPERAVGNLLHGFVVGWYDAQLPTTQLQALASAAASTPRFLVVGWTRGTFPGGQHFVLTSWGHTERCRSVSPTVITAFVQSYGDRSPQAGAGGGPNTPPSDLASPPPTPRPKPRASPTKKK